jgi:hypothetical protein
LLCIIGAGGYGWIALQCLTGTAECIQYGKDDASSNTWTNSVIKTTAQKEEGKLLPAGPFVYYAREDKVRSRYGIDSCTVTGNRPDNSLSGSDQTLQVESYRTAEKLYNLIYGLLEKKHLLCCSIRKDEEDKTKGEGRADLGLVTGHAYSILRVEYLEISDSETERFIKLRNPWGSGEWKGKWSDGDQRWKK